jgi:hypothetical protein
MARTIVCPPCQEYQRGRQVMRFLRDVDGGAVFVCDACGTTRMVTNDKLGRPRHAGPRKRAVGVGYRPVR